MEEQGDIAQRSRKLASQWRSQSFFAALVDNAPGPIAHEVKALADTLDTGDTGGALFQIRDTVEVTIKFCTLLLASDLIGNGADEDRRDARRWLFEKPMALGNWVEAFNRVLKRVAGGSDTHLVLQSFADSMRTSGLARALNDFARFRNDEIGHGAFSLDPLDRLRTITEVLGLEGENTGVKAIMAVLGALEWPVLLVEQDVGTRTLIGERSVVDLHRDSPPSPDHRVELKRCHIEFKGRQLVLSPFVTARTCGKCRHCDVFLFDSSDLRGKHHRFDLIDYTQGHKFADIDDALSAECRDLGEELIATRLERATTADRQVVEQLDAAVAQVSRYVPPDHLRNPVAQIIKSKPASVIWLQAPAHTGKSVFARRIGDIGGMQSGRASSPADPLPVDDLVVFGVFIQRGWRSDVNRFMTRFVMQLARAFKLTEDDVGQLLGTARDEGLVAAITQARRRAFADDGPVLAVIDGLDELDGTDRGLEVLDLIPREQDLAEGIHFLLTSRRPGDGECPGWLGARLGRRLEGGAEIMKVSVSDEGYRRALRRYADAVLGKERRLTDDQFEVLMERAEGLFLFISFLVEQIYFRRLAPEYLADVGRGDALFTDYLSDLRKELGHRRLVAEAEGILLALAAEERAHAWEISDGLLTDYAGEPLETTEPDWRGMPLDRLALYLDGDGELGFDGYFLYTLYRLKSVLGVDRGEAGAARFRLWLKDLAHMIAADPVLGPRLPDVHALAATRLMDAGIPDYRALAHAVLSASEPLLHRAVQSADLLGPLMSQAVALYYDRTAYAEAVRLNCAAIALIQSRKDSATSDDRGSIILLASAYGNRAIAKMGAIGHAAAVVDCDTAIALREGLRTVLAEASEPWPPAWQNDLARAYINRGLVNSGANGDVAAIPDCDTAIALMQGLRAALAEAGEPWPPEWQNDLANAHMNRGNAKMGANGDAAAIPDYDTAIALEEGLRTALAEAGEPWPPKWQNDLANAHMNRGSAKMGAIGHAASIEDYDTAIELMEGLRTALAEAGEPWPPAWQNDLATTCMNRATAKMGANGDTAAIPDYHMAIALMEGLRAALAEAGEPWPPAWQNDLANAHVNRGLAKMGAIGREAATADFDTAIALREGLRAVLAEAGEPWPPAWQNDLARAYMNRGLVNSGANGDAAAIPDCDSAIALMEGLRAALAEAGEPWPPAWQNDLANAHMNRGNAKMGADGDAAAIPDYDTAIALGEGLRTALAEAGEPWPPKWQNDLALAHMNRGLTKMGEFGHAAAIPDYDTAIELMEGLRAALVEAGEPWPPAWQNDLARTCMNRATAKMGAIVQAAAIADYDTAIACYDTTIDDYDTAIALMMEGLRAALAEAGEHSPRVYQRELAATCMFRGLAKSCHGDFTGAEADFVFASSIMQDLFKHYQRAGSPVPADIQSLRDDIVSALEELRNGT